MLAFGAKTTLTEALMRLFCAFVDDCVMRGLLDDDDVDGEPVRRLVMVGADRAVLDGVIGDWLACDDFKSDVSNGDGVVGVPGGGVDESASSPSVADF